MANQTREEILDKLEAVAPQCIPDGFVYQYLLLELLLDVLVDIRDRLDGETPPST